MIPIRKSDYPMCRQDVKDVQHMLNSIRIRKSGNWPYLKEDGLFGNNTEAAVIAYQRSTNDLSIDGIVGDKTMKYLLKDSQVFSCSSNPSSNKTISYKSIIRKTAKDSYKLTSLSITTIYKVDNVINPKEKNLAFLFNEWLKIIDQQHDGLLRRISKFPEKKKMRARNVQKQLEFCKKFITKAKRYGINTASVEMGPNVTKTNAIKYIRDVSETISCSSLTKGVKALTKLFEKIKKILSPIINVLNEIPGLKYFSVIEKICKATLKMFNSDFEGAFKLYLDGLRELFEQIVIDAAVVALVTIGGWIALVIAIVIIVGSLVLDYFFFSDNPGESLSDKYLQIKTRNVIQNNVAPRIYRFVND